MIFHNYSEIPYPFLHDAALVLSKRFNLKNIYMDSHEELCLTFKGKLKEKNIKEIFKNLNPCDSSDEDYDLASEMDYSYSDDEQNTYIYSLNDIDYREL